MEEREYRQMASETMGLAQRATSAADKTRLLKLAAAWLDLLERHRRILGSAQPATERRSGRWTMVFDERSVE
jgi:hypothetical protein